MADSKYRYLSEKLGDAIRFMLVPEDNAQAIARAMHEVWRGSKDVRIEEDEQAERWRRRLMDVIEGGGGGWEINARAMTPDERREFARTTWELWAWAHRTFWVVES